MTELYFSARTGKITDADDIELTPEQAKEATLAGPYACNISFNRLISNDFDVAATLREYEELRV